MEDLPFRVDPPKVNMSKDDVSVPVELTFYGNETLEPGVYEGKVTFLAYTGGFVAMGIKIKARINLLGEVQEEEPEMSVEEETDDKSQENIGNPYVIGGVAGAAIAACVALIFVWWKRR
jgi:hypothetical protein